MLRPDAKMIVQRYIFLGILLIAFLQEAPARIHEQPRANSAHSATLTVSTPSPLAKTLFEKGMADFLNQKTELALQSWRAAASNDPKCALIPAFISFTADDPAEETRERDAAKRLGGCGTQGEKLLIRWVVNVREDNYVVGIAAMNDLLAMYPRDKRLLYLAAHWLLQQQSYDMAKSLLDRALAVDGHYPAALNDLAIIDAATGNFQEAFSNMERCVALLPKEPTPQHSYAEILRRGGNFQAALERDRAALKLDPAFHAAQLGIADTYALMGEEETARKQYAIAIRIASDDSQKITDALQSALTYIREGKAHKAHAALQAIAARARASHLAQLEAEAYRFIAAYQASDADALRFTELAEAALEGKQPLLGADVAEEQAKILELRSFRGASAGRTDISHDALEQLSHLAGSSRSTNIRRSYEAALGAVLVVEHKETEAIPHLEEDDRNPCSMQKLVVAYDKAGSPDKAHALELRLAAINEPTLEQALVVPELRARLAAVTKRKTWLSKIVQH